jgi:hypothetical protein
MADTIAVDHETTANSALVELRGSLSDLRYITLRLHHFGFVALIFTVLNFASLILSLSLRYLPVGFFTGVFLAFYLPILATLLAMVGIVRYDTLRKRGDALFEEISDELQWNIRIESKQELTMAERPELNARVALRSFARATDLPLVPGKYGPGIYATINFLMLLLSYSLVRVFRF